MYSFIRDIFNCPLDTSHWCSHSFIYFVIHIDGEGLLNGILLPCNHFVYVFSFPVKDSGDHSEQKAVKMAPLDVCYNLLNDVFSQSPLLRENPDG